MSDTKGARVLCKRCDDMLGQLAGVIDVRFVVGDVKVVSGDQSDPQHDLGHVRRFCTYGMARSVGGSPVAAYGADGRAVRALQIARSGHPP